MTCLRNGSHGKFRALPGIAICGQFTTRKRIGRLIQRRGKIILERIFICTVGNAPAVVTETLWALKNDPSRPWVPSRIEIVTTMFGLRHVSRKLQSPTGPMSSLFKAGIPPVTICVPKVDGDRELDPLILEWTGGQAPELREDRFDEPFGLRDIVSERDARVMGDLIKERVWAATNPGRHGPETEIHISIAGGRKTMSAHALLSLALVGRVQDEASHVLISPEFEDHPDFWHVDQDGLINTKKEMADFRDRMKPLPPPSLDPSTARIELIRTPTPLVTELDPARESLGKLRLSEIIRQIDIANRFRRRPHIFLDASTNSVSICNHTVEFNIVPFAQLRLLATAAKENWGTNVEVRESPRGWFTIQHQKDENDQGYESLILLATYLDDATRVALSKEKGEVGNFAAIKRDRNPQLAANNDIRKWVGDYREKNKVSKDDPEANAKLWLKSFTGLKNELTEKFGRPLANLLIKRLPKKAVKGQSSRWGFGLSCPPDSIEIT